MIRTVAAPRKMAPATGLLTRIAQVNELWRQRRALSRLDATGLKDIGLTEGEACRETRRGLWDAPQGWKM